MSILFNSQGTGSYLPVFRIRIRIQKDPGFLADPDPDFKTRIRIHALVHKKSTIKNTYTISTTNLLRSIC